MMSDIPNSADAAAAQPTTDITGKRTDEAWDAQMNQPSSIETGLFPTGGRGLEAWDNHRGPRTAPTPISPWTAPDSAREGGSDRKPAEIKDAMARFKRMLALTEKEDALPEKEDAVEQGM